MTTKLESYIVSQFGGHAVVAHCADLISEYVYQAEHFAERFIVVRSTILATLGKDYLTDDFVKSLFVNFEQECEKALSRFHTLESEDLSFIQDIAGQGLGLISWSLGAAAFCVVAGDIAYEYRKEQRQSEASLPNSSSDCPTALIDFSEYDGFYEFAASRLIPVDTLLEDYDASIELDQDVAIAIFDQYQSDFEAYLTKWSNPHAFGSDLSEWYTGASFANSVESFQACFTANVINHLAKRVLRWIQENKLPEEVKYFLFGYDLESILKNPCSNQLKYELETQVEILLHYEEYGGFFLWYDSDNEEVKMSSKEVDSPVDLASSVVIDFIDEITTAEQAETIHARWMGFVLNGGFHDRS